MKNPLVVFVILALSCTVIRVRVGAHDDDESSLFLMSVKPLQYDLYINISFEASSFNGKVDIKFELLSFTNNISINASELKIKDKGIRIFYNNKLLEIEPIIDKKNGTINILFDQHLQKGEYIINIEYKGNFNTSMRGLHLSKYDLDKGDFAGAMAVTYLQPMYARYVFPCFDDPKLKANFNISISRNKGYIAISNMPLKFSKDIGNNQTLDVFELTPELLTNEVAFAVFNCSTPSSYPRGNIYTKRLRVNVRKNYYHRTYLENNFESILQAIENYFHMPLPMKKVDILGVRELPKERDGIGNWGLVLILEDNFLLNGKIERSIGEQDILMSVINYNLQGLLGHVCNPASDNNCSLLTEGIGRFLQYSIADLLKPDWRLTEQRALTLLRDVVAADHPTIYNLVSPEPYPQKDVYDQYKKAASIMLTLQNIVRQHNFQTGLQHFVHRSIDICSFGETVTSDNFWISLQEVADLEKAKIDFNPPLKIENIAEVMRTWDEQPDIVPVIYVRRNYTTAPFEFTFIQYPLFDLHNQSRGWYIPINYATRSKPHLFKILRPTGGFMEPTKPYKFPHHVGQNEWLIINVEAAYLYLVNYDDINWMRIAKALDSENFGNIPPLTRAKLIYDAFTLVLFDRLHYKVALELVKYLWREKDYIPLNSLFYVLDLFYSNFAGIENFHHFEAYISKALQPALEHVGFREKEPPRHIDNLNRIQLIKWLCLFGNQLCRKTTTDMLLGDFLAPPYVPPPDLKEAVICAGHLEANTTVWNRLNYFDEDAEDDIIIDNFGCSQNEQYLSINIERNLDKDIPVFDKIYSKSYFGINFVLKYLLRNWEKVNTKLLEKNVKIDLIKKIARLITTDVQLSMLQNITKMASKSLDTTFENDVGTAKGKVLRLKLHGGGVADWIRDEIINEGSSTVKVSFYVCFIIAVILFNFLS